MVSWRFCDTDNESAGYKESFLDRTSQTSLPLGQKQNFSNRDKFAVEGVLSKRAKFNVDFENNWLFRKTSLRDEKLRFFFVKQTRISIIPTRKADPNIFLISLKRDYIDTQYVKLPYSIWPFPIFLFYCANEGKMFKNFIILKDSTLLDVMQIKSHDLFKRDFDMLRILNLPIRA